MRPRSGAGLPVPDSVSFRCRRRVGLRNGRRDFRTACICLPQHRLWSSWNGGLLAQDVPIGATQVSLAQLSDRSREIFRQIVESYLATGEPVGSRNISRLITTPLSPASVRDVMSDLEQLGLVYAPHSSAGRLPTELGLRFFVDALMEIGDLAEDDRRAMEAKIAASGK